MKRIIYGTGKYGRRLYSMFMENGVGVDYFAESILSGAHSLFGIPIITIEDISGIKDRVIVCIAIKNKATVRSIVKNIKQSKVQGGNIIVYDYAEFIENAVVYNRTSSGGKKHCFICDNDLDEFIPAGIDEDIFKKHNIIGGGMRNNCLCPICGCSDRERWFYYVLKKKIKINELQGRLLHFAPERAIRQMINYNDQIDYYAGDIAPDRNEHLTDITNIEQYNDRTFDIVICNHVLEHIEDETKAISEIKRVLKDDGKFLFSFPICTDMDITFEDRTITKPEERLKKYGQEDHVRLYGRDYVKRFEKYGFKIKTYSPYNYFNMNEIDRYGFIKDDVILAGEKI